MMATKRVYTVKRIYDEILSVHIVPYLCRLGFEKRGRYTMFYKDTNDTVYRVAVGFRKVAGLDEGWLLITVGVGFRSLAEFLAPCQVALVRDVKLPCAMATDLGHLHPPYRFGERHLSADTRAEQVGKEVIAELEQYGKAFFESYGTLEKVLAAWEAGTWFNLGAHADFYMAAAYWLRGERARAIEFVRGRITHYDELYKEKERNPDLNLRIQREELLGFLLKGTKG